jgi:hypothetical protein
VAAGAAVDAMRDEEFARTRLFIRMGAGRFFARSFSASREDVSAFPSMKHDRCT